MADKGQFGETLSRREPPYDADVRTIYTDPKPPIDDHAATVAVSICAPVRHFFEGDGEAAEFVRWRNAVADRLRREITPA